MPPPSPRAQVRAEKRSQYVMVLEDQLDRRRAAARAKDEAWQKVCRLAERATGPGSVANGCTSGEALGTSTSLQKCFKTPLASERPGNL